MVKDIEVLDKLCYVLKEGDAVLDKYYLYLFLDGTSVWLTESTLLSNIYTTTNPIVSTPPVLIEGQTLEQCSNEVDKLWEPKSDIVTYPAEYSVPAGVYSLCIVNLNVGTVNEGIISVESDCSMDVIELPAKLPSVCWSGDSQNNLLKCNLNIIPSENVVAFVTYTVE